MDNLDGKNDLHLVKSPVIMLLVKVAVGKKRVRT
jgi:hypothetical protein